jgi:hypothetical protein
MIIFIKQKVVCLSKIRLTWHALLSNSHHMTSNLQKWTYEASVSLKSFEDDSFLISLEIKYL